MDGKIHTWLDRGWQNGAASKTGGLKGGLDQLLSLGNQLRAARLWQQIDLAENDDDAICGDFS